MQPTHFSLTAGLAIALALGMPKPATAQITREETDWLPQSFQTIRVPIRGTSTTFTRGRSDQGNPGRALIYDTSVRAEAESTNASAAIVIASELFHDAALDGEMHTLSFSQSLFVETTDAVSALAIARFLISQVVDGERVIFAHEVAVAPVFGRWQTISAFDLREDDFARFDFATGDLVADARPDFGRDFSKFGIGLGARVTNDTDRAVRERLEMRVDNLSVTISPVPEPATAGMLLTGLLLIVASARARVPRRMQGVG